MTSTISKKTIYNDLNSITSEEQSIDEIVGKLGQLNSNFQIDKIEEIRNDLLGLRKKLGESDFKTRYLKAREKALQQFIDDFPSMLGYWNKELKCVHSNKVYADYFGKSPDEIRGKTMLYLLGERIFKLNLPHVNAVLSGKPQTFEREIPTPNGTKKSTLASYIPHFVSDEVIGFFVVVTDISEKKRLEEKAKTLETFVYEQSRLSSLGQMASGIAHEIMNPVAIIYSDACLLKKEFTKKKPNKKFLLERLAEVESTALRIEKIVDGLRSLYTGKSATTLLENDLTEIVDQVLSICSHRFIKAGIKINWERPRQACPVTCNSTQISEILLNLLNNAFDEIKDIADAHVTITLDLKNGKYEVKVSNNGSEIKPEVRKLLFVPFYTTKGKNGTGLGLKISQDLARANGGELFLSDKKETEFVLILQALIKE